MSKTYFCHNALSFRSIHMKPKPICSLFNSLSSDRSEVKVKITKRSKTYFGHNTLSFRLIHMKPTPKGSLFNSLSSDRSKVKIKVMKRSITYFGHNMHSFHPIHMNLMQTVHFSILYHLIGQRSRSRSRKRQKLIFVITLSVFIWFIWNQRQYVHFSIPYPLIGQRSRSRSHKGQKHILVITLSFHTIHMKPTPKGSLLNSLSSDRSKVKIKVTKRSKTYLGHNTLSFRHMKPTPKFLILWYGNRCGFGEGMRSTECLF